MRLQALVLSIAVTLCGLNDRARTSKQDSLQRISDPANICPKLSVDTRTWTRVSIADSSASIQLPPGSYELASDPVRQWALPDGRSIAYKIQASDSLRPGTTAGRSRGQDQCCLLANSNDSMLVHVSHSVNGYKEGYLLDAITPLSANKTLRLIGFSKDSAGIIVPLAIARSVQITRSR